MTTEKSPSLLRLEIFTDAVFAVAITIMVLDLRPPQINDQIRQNAFDFSFINQYWPKLFAFALGFLIIAGMWTILIGHFRRVTQAGWVLIWLSMMHLFAICLIPWGTAFVAENPTLPQAVSMYGALCMLAMATGAAIYRKIEIDYPTAHKWGFRKDLAIVGIWSMSIPLAFVTVYSSFVIFVVLSLLSFLPKHLHERIFLPLFERRPIQAIDDSA